MHSGKIEKVETMSDNREKCDSLKQTETLRHTRTRYTKYFKSMFYFPFLFSLFCWNLRKIRLKANFFFQNYQLCFGWKSADKFHCKKFSLHFFGEQKITTKWNKLNKRKMEWGEKNKIACMQESEQERRKSEKKTEKDRNREGERDRETRKREIEKGRKGIEIEKWSNYSFHLMLPFCFLQKSADAGRQLTKWNSKKVYKIYNSS